jgi:5-methylcytosine-specific restriction protein A
LASLAGLVARQRLTLGRLSMLGPRIATLDTARAAPVKEADPFYSTPEYQAWQSAVVKRADGRCQDPKCKRPWRTGIRLFADHVVELQDDRSLALDTANGMARCGSCHTRKTSEERARRAAR